MTLKLLYVGYHVLVGDSKDVVCWMLHVGYLVLVGDTEDVVC